MAWKAPKQCCCPNANNLIKHAKSAVITVVLLHSKLYISFQKNVVCLSLVKTYSEVQALGSSMDLTCTITLFNLIHSVTVPPAHSELHHRVCPDVPCAVRKQCVAEKQSSEQGKPHHIKTVFPVVMLLRTFVEFVSEICGTYSTWHQWDGNLCFGSLSLIVRWKWGGYIVRWGLGKWCIVFVIKICWEEGKNMNSDYLYICYCIMWWKSMLQVCRAPLIRALWFPQCRFFVWKKKIHKILYT